MSQRTIDQEKTSTLTGEWLQARPSRRVSRLVAWATFGVLVASIATSALAQDEDAEGEPDHLYSVAVESQQATDPPNKALGCNPNGTYCSGLYDELVDWVRYQMSGQVEILPTATVRASIQAGGVCELFQGNKVLIPADEEYADRVLNQIVVARVFGERFRMNWIAGPAPDNYCELRYLIVPY